MDTRSLRLSTRVILGAVFIAASLPLAAHHGTNISYDRAKQWTKPAVVQNFEYRNPHPHLAFEIKDENGAAQHWDGELLPNPAQLMRNGWTRKRSVEALKPGTPITVTIAPAKAGGTVGLLLRIVNMQGEELVLGDTTPGGRQSDPDAGRQGGGGRGSN